MLDEELQLIKEARTLLQNHEVYTFELDLNKEECWASGIDLQSAADKKEVILILNPAENYSKCGFYDGVMQVAKVIEDPELKPAGQASSRVSDLEDCHDQLEMADLRADQRDEQPEEADHEEDQEEDADERSSIVSSRQGLIRYQS